MYIYERFITPRLNRFTFFINTDFFMYYIFENWCSPSLNGSQGSQLDLGKISTSLNPYTAPIQVIKK